MQLFKDKNRSWNRIEVDGVPYLFRAEKHFEEDESWECGPLGAYCINVSEVRDPVTGRRVHLRSPDIYTPHPVIERMYAALEKED